MTATTSGSTAMIAMTVATGMAAANRQACLRCLS